MRREYYPMYIYIYKVKSLCVNIKGPAQIIEMLDYKGYGMDAL